MSDLIDRQEAIDALTEYGNGRTVYIGVEEAIRRIEQLPPAQPEKRTEERTETHGVCLDTISRQAAIDLIKNDAFWVQYTWGGRGHKPEMEMVDDLVESIIKQMKESVMSRLKQMPSAQPEIIRCKDCKWFMKEYGWDCIEFTICGVSPTHHPIRREEDFCSHAERREE